MNDLVLTPDELAIGKRAQAALLASAGAAAPRPHPWARPATAKPAPVASPLPSRAPSERALTGALLQDPDAVFPLADAAGIESEAFTDSDCLRIWRAAAVLRHQGKPADMVAIAEAIGGDAYDAMQLFSELVDACPTTAYASRYVDQVAEGQRRRKLSDAARMAAEALAKGGDVSVVAGQLKAAGEAVGGSRADAFDPLAGRKSLAELAEAPIDPEQTLLGNRFLCRRGAMLYVGRSGLGKSSSSGQQDACWALGREAFGILPAKPLNILCIQAENDDGDLHEMAAGVFLGLGLTEAEIAEVHQRTTYVQWFESGEAFLTKLRDALAAEREAGRPFDLVRIDPLLSFAGGDLVNPAVIASFCRAGLNSIAYDFNCGIIAVHHTPKLNLTARPRMDGPEWIYAATGCADLANWARAILVIADGPNAMPGTFRLIGAKRGKRITWRDTEGEMEFERYFSHAENRGGMFWRPATPEETEVATARAAKDKKPTALQEIAGKDAATMESHALNILRKGPLTAADFRAGIMREFRINENYAKTVAKWLSEGDGKPVLVKILGKVHWHGTADQLAALQNPPLKGVK